MLTSLGKDTPFPPAERALHTPNGLLAVGGDLSATRLLEAYRNGIFPWFSPDEPILWWSPDPRMVIVPGAFSPNRSLRRVLRRHAYEVRIDTAFADVIAACAAPRDSQSGTWISNDMQQAYLALHALGHAHSFETWVDGELVGGLYGVALGQAFFGESMFSRATDASKIAFAHLCAQLAQQGFVLLDCQMHTPHLASLGAHEMPRRAFLTAVRQHTRLDGLPGPWTLHPALHDGTYWTNAG